MRRVAPALILILSALALGACGGDDDSTPTDATTTSAVTAPSSTAASTAPPATTAAATTAATASPTTAADVTSPEAAAKALYGAWRNGDDALALSIAEPAAHDAMFATEPNGPGWTFQGCGQTGATAECSWYYEGGGATMSLVEFSDGGWHITEVSFVAD